MMAPIITHLNIGWIFNPISITTVPYQKKFTLPLDIVLPFVLPDAVTSIIKMDKQKSFFKKKLPYQLVLIVRTDI